METIITYVAKDGTKFNDKYECMDYEEEISIQQIYDSGMRFYNSEFKPIEKENILDSNNIAYIYIPNEEIYYSLVPVLKQYLYGISIVYTNNGYYYYNPVTEDYESLEGKLKHLLNVKKSLEGA